MRWRTLCLLAFAAACGGGDDASVQDRDSARPTVRIVSLSPELSRLLIELGLAPAIVAADADSCEFSQLSGAVSLGALEDRDVETAANLVPDIVLGLDRPRQQRFAEHLLERGATTRLFAPRGANEVARAIREIGLLLQLESRATYVATQLHLEVARIAMARDYTTRHRVAWVLRRDPIVVVGGAGLLHEMLELAGAENVFHLDDLPEVEAGVEGLALLTPDVILDSSAESEQGRILLQRIGSTTRIETITEGLSVLPTIDLARRVRELHEILYGSTGLPTR